MQREIDHYNLDMIIALDDQILRLRKNILEGTGTVSHQEAIEKAEREFEIYREREMRMLESDFDKAVKRLKNLNDESNELENWVIFVYPVNTSCIRRVYTLYSLYDQWLFL